MNAFFMYMVLNLFFPIYFFRCKLTEIVYVVSLITLFIGYFFSEELFLVSLPVYVFSFIKIIRKQKRYVLLPFFIWNILLFMPFAHTFGMGDLPISSFFTKELDYEAETLLNELDGMSQSFLIFFGPFCYFIGGLAYFIWKRSGRQRHKDHRR